MTRRAVRQAEAGADDAGYELVHAETLRFFPELVAELGGDPAALFRRAGLPHDALDGEAPRVNYRAMILLLEAAAAALGRSDFGLLLATRQGGGRVFGPMGVVMRNSATFGDALGYVADHIHAYSRAASLRVERLADGERVQVAFDVLVADTPSRGQLLEQLLLLAHLNAAEITGGAARVREIRFRHQPLSPPRIYRRLFNCPVRFGQATDAMIYAARDLDAAVVAPDARRLAQAAGMIDAAFPDPAVPVHARVRALLMGELGLSDCRLEEVAHELRLHPRTLNRRLAAERRSFGGIRDEVRRDRARYYIERTDLPFGLVCEKLGYAEASVFSRAGRRWFGCSPRVLRARRGGGHDVAGGQAGAGAGA